MGEIYIQIAVDVLFSILRFFGGIFRAFRRDQRAITRKILSGSRRGVARVYVKHLKRGIRKNFKRRTGTLLRSPKVKLRIVGRRLKADPIFPLTKFQNNKGQYAFVLDHYRPFIQRALRNARRDPAMRAVIGRSTRRVVRNL